MTEDDMRRMMREEIQAALPRLRAEIAAAERPLTIRFEADPGAAGRYMAALAHPGAQIVQRSRPRAI